QRYRRVDDSGQSIQTETHYVGSVEWIYKPGSVVITKRYLDGEAIATTTQSGGSVQQDLHYLLKDHLGSTDLITTAIGDIVQAQSFDAYGMRRYDDDFTALTLASRLNFDTSWTTRGFTGHEGMDPVGLVHMNGRVYDPKLGRFVSGDPFVQDPANTQSFNRYSYVFNNPLSYTDPSGYLSLKEAAGIVVGAVVTYVTFGAAGGFAAANFLQGASAGALAGAAGGFASGAIMTGSVTGAFSGALTGAAFGGLTGGFAGAHQSLFSAKAFLSFGTLGGITSVLHGGKFGHGFASAGFGTLAGAAPFLQGGGFGGQLITRAVVGGTLSEATGGKFANGAAYAAFASLVEISMTRVGRSHTAFKNEVMIDSNVEHPAILVELIVDDTALMPDPNTDVPRLAAFHVAPMSSAANVDYSATGGVDASFSRQRGLEGYVVGGYTTAQFNELAGPAVSVATAPVLGVAGRGAVVGAMAARQFLLSHSGEVRIAVTMVLEANAAAVSHTTQFMMSNAPRALHSVYKPFVSPYRPPSTVPSTLVIP
ncbi:MAG: RHS repeat-associated core domain-containing protein, partial [Pseudomonadales bacterium]